MHLSFVCIQILHVQRHCQMGYIPHCLRRVISFTLLIVARSCSVRQGYKVMLCVCVCVCVCVCGGGGGGGGGGGEVCVMIMTNIGLCTS